MIDPDSPVATLDSGAYRDDSDISVYFVQSGTANAIPSEDITSEGWTQTEINRVMAALATISNYIDVTFDISTDPNADFQMVLDNDEFGDEGYLGFFYTPFSAGDDRARMGAFNENGYGWSTDGLEVGGLGFSTVIHEALHGLGLDHPHDGDTILEGLDPSASNYPFGDYGDFGLNQSVYTIMSYNDGYVDNSSGSNFEIAGNAATPMALDIALLQELYGANTNYNSGSNTYELPDSDEAWVSIWDTGGIDEITYSGSKDTVIDLREATLQYEVGGGGFISAAGDVAGGFTIANGAVIENATSGSGDDTLIGNNADNVLTANGGNDQVFGGAGDDEINTGSGADEADGNSGADQINATSGTNTIYGSSGFDDIQGGSDVDTIFGGSGDDEIDGGASGDFLFGGRGDDDISGGSGADQITGGLGVDVLTGDAGADDFIFEFISDSSVGNADTITDFGNGADIIDLTNFGGLSFDDDIMLSVSGGDTTVQIDTNGDNNIDMEIVVEGVTNLMDSNFLL